MYSTVRLRSGVSVRMGWLRKTYDNFPLTGELDWISVMLLSCSFYVVRSMLLLVKAKLAYKHMKARVTCLCETLLSVSKELEASDTFTQHVSSWNNIIDIRCIQLFHFCQHPYVLVFRSLPVLLPTETKPRVALRSVKGKEVVTISSLSLF